MPAPQRGRRHAFTWRAGLKRGTGGGVVHGPLAFEICPRARYGGRPRARARNSRLRDGGAAGICGRSPGPGEATVQRVRLSQNFILWNFGVIREPL